MRNHLEMKMNDHLDCKIFSYLVNLNWAYLHMSRDANFHILYCDLMVTFLGLLTHDSDVEAR